MAIQTPKKKVVAKQESTSLHFPNETTKKPDENGQEVLNNQDPMMLTDPDEEEGGSTHFNNLEKYNQKSNRMNGGKTTAAQKSAKAAALPKKAKSVKAGIAEDDADGLSDPDFPDVEDDEDATFGEGDEDSGVDAATEEVEMQECPEPGLQDTQHFDNDIDPTDGYLTVGEVDDILEVDDDDDVSDEELEVGDNPQSLLEIDDEGGGVFGTFDDEDEDEFIEEEEEVAGVDDMSILDVDGTDDEGDDAVFATVGTSLKVIKGNRIIASMGKKVAAKAGNDDVYLSDQFQEATFVEMKKHGLRAGLKNMGFVLASVNVGGQDVLNRRVDAKAQKMTAAVRRATQASTDALEQSLAIAAVGINRQYFTDSRNALRAALEEELTAAGVRGATRLVRSVFASHGIEYAKDILTLGQKLAAMPEETRNSYASALDLVSASAEDMDDSDQLFGDESGPDFQSEFAGGNADSEFDDELEHVVESPSTVHAALLRPLQPYRGKQSTVASSQSIAKGKISVTAAQILQGKRPLNLG